MYMNWRTIKSITLIFVVPVFAVMSISGRADAKADEKADVKPDVPAKVVADQTTPAGAMLLFIRAMEAGDADAAIALCELRADDDKEMIEAVTAATMAHASRAMHRALDPIQSASRRRGAAHVGGKSVTVIALVQGPGET